MKHLLFVLIALFISTGAFAQSAEKEILGKWTNQDKSHIIEFVKNGATYEAIILKAENPDVINKKQITGLKFNKDKSFKDGTVHIFKKGKTANCKVKIVNSNKLEITASKGFMSKTETWTRHQ